MTDIEFEFEMSRLNEAFKGFYTKSKIKLIRSVIIELPGTYFERCVDRILWQREPPKIEWFNELISSYRKKQSVKYTLDQMHPAENSIFDDKAISMMKAYAGRRIDGRLSDTEYINFLTTIHDLISSKPSIKCKICLDAYYHIKRGTSELSECSICQKPQAS